MIRSSMRRVALGEFNFKSTDLCVGCNHENLMMSMRIGRHSQLLCKMRKPMWQNCAHKQIESNTAEENIVINGSEGPGVR